VTTRTRHTAAPRPRARDHLRLIGLRVNEGLSREQLALRANVSRESVRMAEGGFVPGPRVQFAIAGVFGLRPLDLWPLDQQRRRGRR
jgi:transcriptional regulator with XRE-family HTH domain